jgi:hypothetical protein
MPAISCGECSWLVPEEFWLASARIRCRVCRREIMIAAFPAVDNTFIESLPEALADEAEASCFYHPAKRAAIPCDECGRFLCQLCDLHLDGRHLCPTCFQTGVASRKLERVEPRRTMYDSVALAMATLPVLLFWPVLFTAPYALWIVVRRWGAPLSIVPPTRIRFYLAALFALTEFAGIVAAIWLIINAPSFTARP